MGQRLHGSARTTAAVRRAIQHGQERLGRLAERDHVNPKMVAKWKKRTHVHDAPMGPKHPWSTMQPGSRRPDRGIPPASSAAAG
jgi:hypothetical protein